MQVERQFTTFLENKPGRLSSVCSALAKERVNIHALTVMDSRDHSALRLVVDDAEAARRALTRLNAPFSETEVIVVELKNQPGAIAQLCERLASEHVNIDYVYCSVGGKNGKATAVLKATPLAKVKDALAEAAKARTKSRLPRRRPPASM